MKSALLLLACVAALSTSGSAQSYPKFDIEHVSGNVYVGVFKRPDNDARIGSKITIHKGADGLLLVDGSFAQLYQLTRIKLKAFSDQDVKYVINTHFHPDHSGANANFINDGATIIAHRGAIDVLSKEQRGHGLSQVGSEDVFPAIPAGGLPNKMFQDSLTVRFNGEDVRITHYPNAHTDGDAVVHFEQSNVFDLGDIIWPGSFAFVDWMNGGSAQGILATVDAVLTESNTTTRYISGHGATLSVTDLTAYRSMLKETIDLVLRGKAQGKSLEELQAEGLPEQWARWSGALSPTPVWIEMIYRSAL